MAVSIHIYADTAADALSELRVLANAGLPAQGCEATNVIEELDVVRHPGSHFVAIAEMAAGQMPQAIAQDAAPAAEKKRGRPKKSETPASSPAQTASDTTATAAPPSPVVEASTPEPTQIPPSAEAPASLSFDEFRSKLLDIANLKPDVNMAHCTKAMNDEGFSKVKDMKDAGAEVYAKVLARAAELVAAA